MQHTLEHIRAWIVRQWRVCKPLIVRYTKILKDWIVRFWHIWTDRNNRWLSIPCTVAALLVLLVIIKSCQGIIYYNSNECRIYRLGYPIDQARALIAVLSEEQADSLIARGEHDTIAYPLLSQRYFIAENFDRYLAYHKKDTTLSALNDIIALVNVGHDRDRNACAVPCDTSKRQLMLVNGRHYLDEHYKPDGLVGFKKTYCYVDQKALGVVVQAFVAMQQECKKQTDAQLMVNSAYRSYKEQIGTYKRNEKGYAARPGSSEHQTGLAIDVTSLQHPMRWAFDTSKEGVWMREHCHEYGFILRYPKKQAHVMGYNYEPWHLRYVGVEVATRIHDEDITFDEYYAYYIEREKV